MATRTTTTRTTNLAFGAPGDESPSLKLRPGALLTLEAVADAYFLCRRGKRNAVSQIAFESNLEANLVHLFEELETSAYRIGAYQVFAVIYPAVREIWAAQFRDRVVHHLVYAALRPRFEPSFIADSFACIPSRGAHAAVDRAETFARRVTHGWRRNAYVLQCDIQSFFNSIDLSILFDLVRPRCHEKWLAELVRKIIFNDPRVGVRICGSSEVLKRVPRHKSLWSNPVGRGLPIGNLTSQFFANIYLNELDQFVKHTLKCKSYARYVDDFILFDECPQRLNKWKTDIGVFLIERLGLKLHPRKTRLAPVHQGFDFVGYIVKPGRRYPRRRTVRRAHHKITMWERNGASLDLDRMRGLSSSLNSYLGLMKKSHAHRQRVELCNRLPSLFFDVRPDYGMIRPRGLQ